MNAKVDDNFKKLDINSSLGIKKLDSSGEAVAGVRMEVSAAYAGIPGLLQRVINENDSSAWTEIMNKIDYIYANIDHVFTGLEGETGFSREVKCQTDSGKKLLFKPNLVAPSVIDPISHGEGSGAPVCTEWPLIAALMRWFHDKLDIRYSQMALGEASTSTFFMAYVHSKSTGRVITTEAVIEGRSDDFYGGWGFFFVRRYLSEHHPSSHTDDPMLGYEDSVAGNYIPPGRTGNRMMVYDLNKLKDDGGKGRSVEVPGGANFKEITLHKAIIGGVPGDSDDLKKYPGCVLVNVPKLKIHAQDLLTNAIKNLGIGLYPTQCPSGKCENETSWKYSYPDTPIPSYKGKIPHSPWILEMDDKTNLPVKGENGQYIARKTAGFSGTQSDIIRAVQSQNVFMLHVVDAIEMINISHNPDGNAVRVPEGYVWASLDCVALDLFCARYCFKTLPMLEALKLKEENGWLTEFVHHVPVAVVDGKNISTVQGLDSPLFRYDLYRYAEERGVGRQQYYVVGWDTLTGTPMASLAGHLGRVDDGKFHELMTETMYYNPQTILHDLQKTILSYAEAYDSISGSSLFKEFMEKFDENNDGVIDYDEKGRKGFDTAQFGMLAYALNLQITEEYGMLKGSFIEATSYIKNTNKALNQQGHDFADAIELVQKAGIAFRMSMSEVVHQDRFIQGMTYGKGKWPSWETVHYFQYTEALYGSRAPADIKLASLYGKAFQYADKVLNEGGYTGSTDQGASESDAMNKYFKALSKGAALLDFTLYVPEGYGGLEAVNIPNVKESVDPGEVFTARFNKGQEVW